VSLNNLGGVYEDLGDSTKALDYYTKSLKNAEESGQIDAMTLALKQYWFFL
jgi:hypothetical protein